MTNETEYGPEIVVDGVRPEWLRDEEEIQIRAVDGYEDWDKAAHYSARPDWWGLDAGQDRIAAIRLPASHPYYTVQSYNAKHGTQFKYWPGGDEAPGDWDGGVALYRGESGRVFPWVVYPETEWIFNPTIPTIIGYTPKSCAEVKYPKLTVIQQAEQRVWQGGFVQTDAGAPQPDFVPCERTLRMAIDAIPREHDMARTEAWENGFQWCRSETRKSIEGLIPKPARVQALVQDITAGKAFSRDGLKAIHWAIEHLIAQGEIRG